MEENVNFLIGVLNVHPELIGNNAMLIAMLREHHCSDGIVNSVIQEAYRRIGH